MVFFAWEGEESEGTQLNKGRFRARSTTTGLVGDTNGSEMLKIKPPKQEGDPETRKTRKGMSPGETAPSQANPQRSLRVTSHQGGPHNADPLAKNPQES